MKLSTKDWESPRLMLLNIKSRPRSKDIVQAICHKCGTIRSVVFIELVRSVNRQSKYIDNFYHCPKCYFTISEIKEEHSRKISEALSKTKEKRSETSKQLWNNPEYREKCENYKKQISGSDEFSKKVSEAMKKKFEDPEYINKVKLARIKYWKDDKYRSARINKNFIEDARNVHGDKYDYSLVDYVKSKNKVIIICPKHGNFKQRPGHHIHYANGCPKCAWENSISRDQSDIANFVRNITPIVENDYTILDGFEIDVYAPAFKFGIEYHGGFWHSYSSPETTLQRTKHYRKSDAAIKSGIRLLQIFDEEWKLRRKIIESMILNKFGLSNKIHGRKCIVVDLNNKEMKEFFNNNHLRGYTYAQFGYGLVFDGKIVSAISFSKKQTYLEIIRFASVLNTVVVGGLSKLLSKIEGDIFTYADRRYSDASGYLSVGFKLCGITKPGYFYWKNNKLYNRRLFQKHKLRNKLQNFNPNLTESENMFINGYRRIWDAGSYKLIKKSMC